MLLFRLANIIKKGSAVDTAEPFVIKSE